MSWYQIVALDTTDSPNVEKMGRYFAVFEEIEDFGEPGNAKSSNAGKGCLVNQPLLENH